LIEVSHLGDLIARRFGLVQCADWPRTLAHAVETVSHDSGYSQRDLLDIAARREDLLREIAGHVCVEESYFFHRR
jgi:hypothetical protein